MRRVLRLGQLKCPNPRLMLICQLVIQLRMPQCKVQKVQRAMGVLKRHSLLCMRMVLK